MFQKILVVLAVVFGFNFSQKAGAIDFVEESKYPFGVVSFEDTRDPAKGYVGVILTKEKPKRIMETPFDVIKDAKREVVWKEFKAKDETIMYRVEIHQVNKKGGLTVNYFIVDMEEEIIHVTGILK